MNNLKKFNTEADYSAATLNYPAVSWVTSTDVVHFDKTAPVPPTPSFSGLTVYYNITDISQSTNLFKYGGGSGSGSGSGSGGVFPSEMIIDGTKFYPTQTYNFDTVGEHIVQYSFADNQIPNNFLSDDTDSGIFSTVTKVEIGDAITLIGLTAFYKCSSLTSITVEAVDPPTLWTGAFLDTNNCPIYVPSQSVDVYKGSTSTGWSEYASRIQAIQ